MRIHLDSPSCRKDVPGHGTPNLQMVTPSAAWQQGATIVASSSWIAMAGPRFDGVRHFRRFSHDKV